MTYNTKQKQTRKQTNKQTNRQTNKQASKQQALQQNSFRVLIGLSLHLNSRLQSVGSEMESSEMES